MARINYNCSIFFAQLRVQTEAPMSADWFAGRLKELREQAGLSQKTLAEKAGLVTSAIGHLEQGLRKPTWETVLTLANVLGVSCEAFTTPPAEETARSRGRPRKAGEGTGDAAPILQTENMPPAQRKPRGRRTRDG
jgi:transcriptional regulator with XRE-family HTH domain